MKGYSRYFWAIHFIGDLFLINFAFFLAYYHRFNTLIFEKSEDSYLFLIFNFLWILVSFTIKLYDIKRVNRLDRILFNLFKAGAINILLISAVLFFSSENSPFSRLHLFNTYALLFVILFIWRFFAVRLISLYRKSGYNYRRVLIVGGNEVSRQLHDYFNSDLALGIRLLGIFSDKSLTFNAKDDIVIGDPKDLQNFSIANQIDEIYYTMPLTHSKKIKELIDFSDKNMIRFKIVPDFRGFLFKRVNIDFFNDVPVITLRQEPLTDIVNRLLKRIFDIIFSLFVIVFILSWLFPIIAILIKLSSKGPILFKQPRSGLDNKEFNCFKFRSMKQSIDAHTKQATKGDMRVTTLGRFLRKTSLDEFPQFFNVLIGDMSIVGPRPHMLIHTEEYSDLIKKYMVRQLVRPGITGAAQVRGYRGETKELKDMEGRVRLDVWYIENWSFSLDLNIIFLTIWNVFRGDEKAI